VVSGVRPTWNRGGATIVAKAWYEPFENMFIDLSNVENYPDIDAVELKDERER
jgi:hypothetical protein